jgi:hypothetical protein
MSYELRVLRDGWLVVLNSQFSILNSQFSILNSQFQVTLSSCHFVAYNTPGPVETAHPVPTSAKRCGARNRNHPDNDNNNNALRVVVAHRWQPITDSR